MNTLKPSDSEIRKVILLESTESDESQSSSGDEWSPNSHSSPFPRKSRHGSCRKFRGEVELLHKTAKHNPGMLMEAALSETGRRYPFREKRPVSYALNTAIPMDDRFLYCYKCQYSYLGGCVKHPVVWVENEKLKVCEEVKHKFVYFQTLKCVCGLQYYLHSAHTAPKEWVIIARSGIPGAGFGAWSNKLIEQGTTFGPYSGDIVHLEAMDGTEYTRVSHRKCHEAQIRRTVQQGTCMPYQNLNAKRSITW
ncbi:Histone-lysine N-methyltransferase PRDM9 [Fasciola hepatica]|uniref:Histone-lysine N-methyltransferase PRDM9 n=1 Tax=Fasciola hepatica TaxID=6192 RepID=A0A4E0RSP2_FASHE|nr:Histone-lysine N-methyltransferase PRDM9 [Fasciola hepatica]